MQQDAYGNYPDETFELSDSDRFEASYSYEAPCDGDHIWESMPFSLRECRCGALCCMSCEERVIASSEGGRCRKHEIESWREELADAEARGDLEDQCTAFGELLNLGVAL